eukprot:jgi/Mesvir1/5330/Mv15420-RA.1
MEPAQKRQRRNPSDHPSFKTMLCHSHQLYNMDPIRNSPCPFGATCTYAHGEHELRQPGAVAAATPSVAATSNYKTKLCTRFTQTGSCVRGAACQFAHGAHDLATSAGRAAAAPANSSSFYKTRLCKAFARGACTRGASCSYAHGPAELRPEASPADDLATRASSLSDYAATPASYAGLEGYSYDLYGAGLNGGYAALSSLGGYADPYPSSLSARDGLSSFSSRLSASSAPGSAGTFAIGSGGTLPLVDTLAAQLGIQQLPPPAGGASDLSTKTSVTVQQRIVACLIGRKGANVHRIKQLARVQVNLVPAPEGSTNRVFEISGTIDGTAVALQLMRALTERLSPPPGARHCVCGAQHLLHRTLGSQHPAYKTKMCPKVIVPGGVCEYGPERCHFAHTEDELRHA